MTGVVLGTGEGMSDPTKRRGRDIQVYPYGIESCWCFYLYLFIIFSYQKKQLRRLRVESPACRAG